MLLESRELGTGVASFLDHTGSRAGQKYVIKMHGVIGAIFISPSLSIYQVEVTLGSSPTDSECLGWKMYSECLGSEAHALCRL